MSDREALFVAGVDGGWSKTIALVADGCGRILGAARCGGSSCTTADIAGPMQVVVDAVQEALTQAGTQGQDVALAVFGLSGVNWPEDHERRRAFLGRAGLARRVVIKNDSFVGLRAGTRARHGVVIAAGTSCNAAVVAPDGREWHFGSYQDYGGASTIGHEAIRAVLRAEDGRASPTALADLVLSRLGYTSPKALLRAKIGGRLDGPGIADLSPLVFAAAYAGDREAARIIAKQGTALAEYATALIRRYEMQRLEFDVVLAGSLFKGEGPLLIDTITQAVHRVAPRAHVHRQRFEPAVGGVLLAYDAVGLEATDAIYDNLAGTVPDPSFFATDCSRT